MRVGAAAHHILGHMRQARGWWGTWAGSRAASVSAARAASPHTCQCHSFPWFALETATTVAAA